VPVQVDHENDKQIEALFKQIETEQKGQLDIFVNCAFKGADVNFSFFLSLNVLL
jgi:NAD(P)-dependent dehydrogenase (short-subunit alcohol dehydrogenase family)